VETPSFVLVHWRECAHQYGWVARHFKDFDYSRKKNYSGIRFSIQAHRATLSLSFEKQTTKTLLETSRF